MKTCNKPACVHGKLLAFLLHLSEDRHLHGPFQTAGRFRLGFSSSVNPILISSKSCWYSNYDLVTDTDGFNQTDHSKAHIVR